MKKSLNVLFVSNSSCYYFATPLYHMLCQGGYEHAKLCLLYSSGCSLKNHYDWWKNAEKNYEVYLDDAEGRRRIKGYSMEDALPLAEWDVISFDNNSASFASADFATCLANAEPYFKELYEYLHSRYPKARFFWNQTWANEVGYRSYPIDSVERRNEISAAIQGVAKDLASRYGLEEVPVARVWDAVRDTPLVTTVPPQLSLERLTLTTRTAQDRIIDDCTHDGDVGGGQYLNACVWYELLTGEDCRKNPYRQKVMFREMDCSISEEKACLFQNTAHQALAKG